MDALIRFWTRAVSWLAIASALLWLTPGLAQAQSGAEATALTIGTPAAAQLGQHIQVQALLVDSSGRPIAHALVVFAIPTKFLHTTSDMVVAQVVTDKDGRVSADIQNRRSGAVALKALYAGDKQYAAANATAQIVVTGDDQLYSEDIGLHIPFFNAPPALVMGGNITVVGEALWPSLTGWPIAAVLIIIWSLYLLVVTRLFRVAATKEDGETDPHSPAGRHV